MHLAHSTGTTREPLCISYLSPKPTAVHVFISIYLFSCDGSGELGLNGNITQGREHRREKEFDGKEKKILAMLTHLYWSLTNNVNNSNSNNYNSTV